MIGLPFAAASGIGAASNTIGYYSSLATNVLALNFRIDSGGTSILNTADTTGGTTATAGVAIYGNSSRLLFGITYQAA
jgi:hypothetical protein